jgi:hypothetical protein
MVVASSGAPDASGLGQMTKPGSADAVGRAAFDKSSVKLQLCVLWCPQDSVSLLGRVFVNSVMELGSACR